MQRTPVAIVTAASFARKHCQVRCFPSVPAAPARDAVPVADVRDEICEKMPGVDAAKSCGDAVRIFRGHGFCDDDIVKAILRAPRILEMTKQLNDLLSYWRTLFTSERGFLKALASHPELVYLKPSAVETRRAELFTVFPKRDMNKLLEACPRLFVDDWDEVMSKIDYIVHDMGIQQGPIAKSKVLDYSLLHIKTRHLFLLRCGVYKTPKPKDKLTKNPPLARIVESPAEEFVRISGLSAEEYAVFEKLVPLHDVDDGDDELD